MAEEKSDVVNGVSMPESTKMLAVAKNSQLIGEFLEAMGSKGVHLMHWQENDYVEPCPGELFAAGCDNGKRVQDGVNGPYTTERACRACGGNGSVPKHVEGHQRAFNSIEEALADYFEIDLKAVDREKAALLKSIQGG